MKTLTFLMSCVLVLIVCGVAGATPLVLTDTTMFTATGTESPEDYVGHRQGDVNFLDGAWDYVMWTHHFDFDPPADEVLGGKLTLSLRDDIRDCFEFALSVTESGNFWFGEVDTQDYSYSVSASSLEDGAFTVFLGSLWGDFYIDQSRLEITYEPLDGSLGQRDLPVPEPATMLLFGIGLVGMAAVGRKKIIRRG